MNKASVAWGAERGEDGVERRGGGAASVVSPARPGEGVRVFRVKNAGAPPPWDHLEKQSPRGTGFARTELSCNPDCIYRKHRRQNYLI